MKIFLLERDEKLVKSIEDCLNGYRLKIDIRKSKDEGDLLKEISNVKDYSLFILNLKDVEDTTLLNFIRSNGSKAPIFLILEKDFNPKLLKKIYYFSYNDVIVKDFSPEEMVFHIYKLCDIWNDDVFFISKKKYFDYKNRVFIYDDKSIHLGRKEALLLKFLFVKEIQIVSFEEIACYVYQNEIISQESIRSLIRQLRAKLPIDLIETVKGEGYRIKK